MTVAFVGALALTAGCGESSSTGDSAPRVTASGAASATASPTDARSSPGVVVEALSLAQLRTRVLDAVRGETTVRMEIGNLNPPPTTRIDQDYASPDGDLELVLSVEPGLPVIAVRRVDGEVYMGSDGRHFEHVPAEKVTSAEETPMIALLRTDVLKDFTALLAGAVEGSFRGADASVGTAVARYDLKIDTDTWFSSQGGDMALGLKHAAYPDTVTARLWIDSTTLPVRLEVKYREPLNGIPGTGTVRIDYSRWSEPVRVQKPAG